MSRALPSARTLATSDARAGESSPAAWRLGMERSPPSVDAVVPPGAVGHGLAGPDRGRRRRMTRTGDEGPTRRRPRREMRRLALIEATGTEPDGRPARQTGERIRSTVEDRNRHGGEDPVPAVPEVNARQIVGAHQPDESRRRRPAPQVTQGVAGVRGPQACLEPRDANARLAGQAACRGQTLPVGQQVRRRLERVARRYQPPHLVQSQPRQGPARDEEVALMGGVEGTAEQTDRAAAGMRQQREIRRQGRVWPLPRTTYLKVVSCSSATGPRACSRLVEMPISAPIPNSPPSAN